MAATFAQKIADRQGTPFFFVTIDSVGVAGSLYRFSERDPTRISLDNVLVLMRERPNIEPERANPLGGVEEQSELTVELVDIDDALSSLFRTEARAQTRLSADVAEGDLQITLDSLSGITLGTTMLFVGREVLTTDSLVGGTTINVGRGRLGTDAAAHRSGRPVYLYTPSLYGRRMRLHLAFDDEGCDASTSTEIGGGWSIDTIEIGEGLNSWRFQGRSRTRHLDRLICRLMYRGLVRQVYSDPAHFNLQGIDARTGATQPNAHFGDVIFLEVGGNEIARVDLVNAPTSSQFQHIVIERRGVGGTLPEEWRDGDEARQVFLADPTDGYGSFRYQAIGDEAADRVSNLNVTDRPVPIMLAILTSHSSSEKLDPDNFTLNETGNYSMLPPGIGLGIPIDLIDVDSFLAVWHRTQNFRLPFFVLRAPMAGREVLDQICRLCGYDLRIVDGKIALSYFRSPLEGEAVTTWNDGVIATEEITPGDRRPIVSVRLDTEFTAGAIVFRSKTARGQETESIFTDVSFPEFFGDADGYYETEDHRIEIDASAVRIDETGAEPEVLKQRALQLLYRFRRPLMRIETATDLAQEGVEAGDLVLLTHAQIPNLIDGTRGVTDLICRVLVKGKLELTESFVGRRWSLIAYGAGGRFGRVCPSARISGVPSAAGGGAYNVPVTANRYTDSAARGDLPTSDGTAFTIGDRIRLRTRGGLPIATVPAYQTVTARTGTQITVDGNFGGSASFTTGTILEYVNRDSTTIAQAASFVHMADDATRTVGATAQTAWTYGEP